MLLFKRKVNKQPKLPKEVVISDVKIMNSDNLCYKQVSYWIGNTRYSRAVKLDTFIPNIGETCPYIYLVLQSIS